MRTKIYFLLGLFSVLGFGGCLENIKPVAHPPATPARPKKKQKNKDAPPLECDSQIRWETTLSQWQEPMDATKKPALPILETVVDSHLNDIRIKIRSNKDFDDFLGHKSSDGFVFGTVPIRLFFDKDYKDHWGLSSAWVNEEESDEDNKQDEFQVHIELGFSYIPEVGSEPQNKTGNFKLDAVKNNILGHVFTYSLLGRNAKGKWVRLPPPVSAGTGTASYKNFTEWDPNLKTITIRIPYSMMNVSNGDVLVMHGGLERNPKDLHLPAKCLRLGF